MERLRDVEKVETSGSFERFEEEIKRLKDELELSIEKIQKLEMEKARLGDEVCVLSGRNEELAERVKWFEGVGVGGESGERSGLCEVKVENRMLECGKRVTEEEIKGVKEEIVELETRVAKLHEDEDEVVVNGNELRKMSGTEQFGRGVDLQIRRGGVKAEAGGRRTPSSAEDDIGRIINLNMPTVVSPCAMSGISFYGSKTESMDGLSTRRKLVYNHARSLSPTVSPGQLTKMNSTDVGIIVISDSEEDEQINQRNINIHGAVNAVPVNAFSDDDEAVFVGGSLKRSFVQSIRNEQLNRITPKRKRVSNVVASDSDSDDIPIGMWLNNNRAGQDQKSSSEDEVETVPTDGTLHSVPGRRQRLMSLSQHYGAIGRGSGAHFATDNASDDGLGDTESEGESLGGFIVKSSDSDSRSSSPNDCTADGNDASVASHLQSDSDVDYGEIMSKLRRDKHCMMNWESEADRLAAFGKDSALCLEALCALYRRQTSDERQSSRSLHPNGRGFNQLDALRGSELAVFLTDGEPFGPVKKSVEELEEYNPNGVEICRQIAIRYSKQLFEIFQNKEDPFFPPEQ